MITNYLPKELIQLDAHAETREEIIHQLAELMKSNGILTNGEDFLDKVTTREKTGSTAIGYEVAIPHGKSDGVARPAVAFARLIKPISWEGEDVSFVFLIAVPEAQAGDEHLKILAALSRKLMHEEFRQQLKMSASPSDIIAAIKE